ncbi:MAG: hypothetical protein CMM01_20915 [Rhodopirellula sp.]|nr:hypothetical protein [Rhodopirellula sp.]
MNKPEDKSLEIAATESSAETTVPTETDGPAGTDGPAVKGSAVPLAPEMATNQRSVSATTPAHLAEFLQQQMQHRLESAEAFQQDTASEPSIRELLEEQLKLQRQVRGIKNHVVRVQQGLLICQFLSVLIAGVLVAIGAFIYLRPSHADRFSGIGESPEAWTQEDEKLNSEWPTEVGLRAGPQVTPDQISMLSNFLRRAREFKADITDQPSVRREKRAGYISLLVDLSKKAEEFANQHQTSELCEMLIKVAKYAKTNQTYENDTQEQKDLYREINNFCRIN